MMVARLNTHSSSTKSYPFWEKTMPTKEQDKQEREQEKQHKAQEKQERQQLNAVIGKHVLHTLGQPGDLHRVQVRPLWDDHYRVNVLVGQDASSAKVAHSYFLVAGSDGSIIASTPKITKHYV
jgi:hypothetical protein